MLSEEKVIDLLYDILDPEIKVNVYDLGMIYGIDIQDSHVKLDITLTSAGCPLAETLEDNISSVFKENGINVSLNWVWTPAWSIDKITEEGKMQLVSIGFPMRLLEKSTWKKREKSDFNE
jgi:metal-sulfur cluster biosynthetic enzyme